MGTIPDEIRNEVVAQQTEMDWPNKVPKYIEFRRDGKELWTEYLKTTVAECEQICEYHTRQGNAAIVRWMATRRAATRRRAAYHILRARLLRLRQLDLMGVQCEDIAPHDLPFPCLTEECDEKKES